MICSSLNLLLRIRVLLLPSLPWENSHFDWTGQQGGRSIVPPYLCSGAAVAPCSPAAVGLTNGAIGQSRVTTLVSFEVSSTGPTPTPTTGLCIGDCNGDREVTVDELIQTVRIALGTANVTACLAGDLPDGDIGESEIIAAVNNALSGCQS